MASAESLPEAKQQEPDSRVTAVTVFRDRARVTREASVVLAPGDERVILRGLPMVLDPESARVSGRGAAGIAIRSLELRRDEAPVQPAADAAAIQAEIEALDQERSLEQERLKSLDILRDLLAQFRTALAAGAIDRSQPNPPSAPAAPPRLDLNSWRSGYDLLSDKLDAIAGEKLRLTRSVERSGEEIELRHARLLPTESQRGRATWTADILLSAPQGGTATLALTYLSPEAAWSPVYDVRLLPAVSRLGLAAFAQIVQRTGEDWRNVDVTLSSTQPLAALDLPSMASLYLRSSGGRAQGGFVRVSSEFIDALPILGRNSDDILTMVDGVSGADGDGNPNTRPAVGSQIDIAAISAEPETRAAGIVYHLPGRLDLPSDGQAHRHLILERSLEAKIEYQAAPAIARSVYVVARAGLPADLSLLPGPVQHFVDDDLVGRSTLPAAPGGSSLQLGFGPEERLVMERREEEKRASRAGDDLETRRRLATTLRNQLERPVTVQVTERLPLSADDRVKVALDSRDTTDGASEDAKDRGVLRWTLRLPPSESREVVLAYSVRSPRGLPLELASARR
ncbi:MAG TPA: mucoidy inhibitor MuiA family protein [Candidatus Polarisedimenticolia bacterium]|nr:mucoidy inhibitor MuiA family protein [Candidatus Polarisedimenticolia bacterium]